MESLTVIFRADKAGRHKGEVTAIFPTLPWNNAGDLTAYAHIGQHGAASLAWYYADTRPARPDEFAPLLRELQQIYAPTRLDVRKRMPARESHNA